MKSVKGYRLYVELNASQVRRRLKGRGLGVRKVESAGSHRAVIIHTATGDHCRALEALFKDVIEKKGEGDQAMTSEQNASSEERA